MKWLGWGALLAAVLSFFFRGRSTDKGELENMHEELQGAKQGAINAGADLDKAKIDHDTQNKVNDNAALSDADIIADAVDEYRR